MKRFLLAFGLLIASVLPASAQLTSIPFTIPAYTSVTGEPAAGHGLCSFASGTSTLKTTYTTAAGTVSNANPILFDVAGRPTASGSTVGIFLVPGQVYRFVLKNFTNVIGSPTCVPDSGTTVWSVEGIAAVPSSSGAVDIQVTAGESIAAGDAVYISIGAGATNAGQMYRTDADSTVTSTNAVLIGIAPDAVSSGSSGTMRLVGTVTLAGGGLSPGQPYYLSGTTGSVTITPPTNSYRIGQAVSATVLEIGEQMAPIGPRGPPCGRLTLTTGVPVTTADVTAATTLFYTPYVCNQVSVFNGVSWNQYGFAQLSIAVPATTSTMYDVFLYDNSGTLTLELTAWTNDTTRATALVLQNGMNVRSAATTRLYLGSFRTTGVSGQTEDSFAKRYVWNAFNREVRLMRVLEATNSWVYSSTTIRQAGGVATNQLDAVVGLAEVAVHAHVTGHVTNDTPPENAVVSIGVDSTTTPATGVLMGRTSITAGGFYQVNAELVTYPAVGRHTVVWLESGAGTGITTFFGDNNTPTLFQSGIHGWYEG